MMTAVRRSIDSLLESSPFESYSYSYPHKTAYRPLEPVVPLRQAWQAERHEALFLYFHIPFCEFRCGFCNLFTLSQPEQSMTTQYLAAIRRQAEVVSEAIPNPNFAHLAFGGGTPTFLSVSELETLFGTVSRVLGAKPRHIPVSCEASPATLDDEKLTLLREFGVDRLSLGVQSFDDQEAHAMGRPQKRETVEQALQGIRQLGFPILNIDLIYGGEGQTIESWLESVEEALTYEPEELYLYPLYVRQLTGLGNREARGATTTLTRQQWDDWRLTAYREARALLLDRGYEQTSFRMFRSPQRNNLAAISSSQSTAPIYRCQEDGMVGIGCGARSYTRELHYSLEYAVSSKATQGILLDYVARDAESFSKVDYGFELDAEDQRRRFAIISILQAEGLSRTQYTDRFGGDVLDDLPELDQLVPQGLAQVTSERLQLTPAGLELSDAIGPWLYSSRVRSLSEDYQWR